MAEEQKKSGGISGAVASKAGAEVGKRVAAKAIAAAAGTAIAGPLGTIAAQAAAEVGSRVATFINKHKGDVVQFAAGAAATPFILAAGLLNAFAIGLAAIGSTLILAIVAIPIVVGFILIIINNSAYMVPPSSTISISIDQQFNNLEPGIISNCPEDDITAELASRITNGEVKLLPTSVSARGSQRLCIKPTMLVMHWSAGSNDNPNGNDGTYSTLVNRNLACQLGTDTNNTELWQPFYEDMVEMAWCANSWNAYGISNEMAGAFFTSSPPPPNLQELELTYDATCTLMEQYNIPWCQIYGHYHVPDSGGKIDPGEDFLENLFIPEIRRRCPNDSANVCG